MRNGTTFAVLAATAMLVSGCAGKEYPRWCNGSAQHNNTPFEGCYQQQSGEIVAIYADGCDELVTYVDQAVNGRQVSTTRCFHDDNCDPAFQNTVDCGGPFVKGGFNKFLYRFTNECSAPDTEAYTFDATVAPEDRTLQCERALIMTANNCTPLGPTDPIPCSESGGLCQDAGTVKTADVCPCEPCVPDTLPLKGGEPDYASLIATLLTAPQTKILNRTVTLIPIDKVIFEGSDGVEGKLPLSGGWQAYGSMERTGWKLLVRVDQQAEQEFHWLADWVKAHGDKAVVTVSIGSWSGSKRVNLVAPGIDAALRSLAHQNKSSVDLDAASGDLRTNDSASSDLKASDSTTSDLTSTTTEK